MRPLKSIAAPVLMFVNLIKGVKSYANMYIVILIYYSFKSLCREMISL